MTTIALTIALVGVVMFGMAVGAIFAGKHLRGSCGGVANSKCSCSAAERRECSSRGAA